MEGSSVHQAKKAAILLFFVTAQHSYVSGQQGEVGDVVPNLHRCDGSALVCPTGTTCCPGGCAPGVSANCCSNDEGGGACPRGSICARDGGCDLLEEDGDNSHSSTARMVLCNPDPAVLTQVYGLVVDSGDAPDETSSPLLPYFSTGGDLLRRDVMPAIKTTVVMFHGYRYNYDADTHLCAAMAAASSRLQQKDEVLFVSAWFLRPSDDISEVWDGDDGRILRWDYHDSWRYGGEGKTRNGEEGVSSFYCLDALVERLYDYQKFPNLESVTFVGDSFGADLVLRWSLLTSAWKPHLRVVGINPYSYVYLTPSRRPLGDTPMDEDDLRLGCPLYDSWEHGLSPGGVSLQYNYDTLLAGSATALADRYAKRDVTYVVGELDTELIASEEDLDGQWCAGALQGFTRYDRLMRYYESLTQVLGGRKNAQRVLVGEGIGHDGPRMLQTESGLEAVFGSPDDRYCPNAAGVEVE